MNERHKNGRPRAKTPEDHMLREFLLAKTPHEKREVIKSFNPFYFTLTPSKAELAQRKEAHEQESV